MKRRISILLMLCPILVLIVLFQCGCQSGTGGPSESIDIDEIEGIDIPGIPYIEKCEREELYRLRIPTKGIMNRDQIFAWLEISKAGISYMISDTKEITTNSFSNEYLVLYFHEADLPEGLYDVMIYMTDYEENVGIAKMRITSAGPYKLHIQYNRDFNFFCVEDIIYLGDSVYFRAESTYCLACVNEYYWQFSASFSALDNDPLNHFNIFNAYNVNSDKYVKLDGNLFMPLKLSRENPEYGVDTIMWALEFIRDRDFGESDTAYAITYVDIPEALGSTNTEYDTLICLIADKFAVPPQIVKGIMNQEEPQFTAFSIRYEMGFDYNWMQPALNNNNHYKKYHIADSARSGNVPGFDRYGYDVIQGDSIQYLSYDPYSVLSVGSTPDVNIYDDNFDGLISALELYNHNLGQNWEYPQSDFVAQIILSSSHGLMHALHCTMIDYLSFGSQNPQDLYDSDEASLYWGIKNLNSIFNDADYVDPTYDWNTKWKATIGKYNGGRGASETDGDFNNPTIDDYVNSVLQYIDIYQPE